MGTTGALWQFPFTAGQERESTEEKAGRSTNGNGQRQLRRGRIRRRQRGAEWNNAYPGIRGVRVRRRGQTVRHQIDEVRSALG